MPLVRRWVWMPRKAPGKGGNPKTWAYGYPELAVLFGMSEGAVRAAVKRGRLVPGELESVIAFKNEKDKAERRRVRAAARVARAARSVST